MKYADFKEFYDIVIHPYLQECKEEGRKWGDCLKVVESNYRINKMYRDYQRKKTWIKSQYMQKTVNALDGHKVAACFIYALMKNRLIKVDKLKVGLPEHILMVNEYLAVTAALNIVDSYHRKSSGVVDYHICIPKTYHDENSESSDFIRNLCKALYYIKSWKHFDVFSYSAILFLLEKYTDVVKTQ